MRIVLLLIFAISCCSNLYSQDPLEKVPTVYQCEKWTNIPGSIKDKYGTFENYMGCIIVGSPSTNMFAVNAGMMSLSKMKLAMDKEGAKDQGLSYYYARLIWQQSQLTANLIERAEKHVDLIYNKQTRDSVANYFKEQAQLNGLEGLRIDRKMADIELHYPEAVKKYELPLLKMKKKCLEKYISYQKGDQKSVANLFLDSSTFNTYVADCAGVKVNFFKLLEDPTERVKKVVASRKLSDSKMWEVMFPTNDKK